ncbi:SCY1 family protein kinase [Trypanosoma grayi]|uniref:SCY1 family protein kinase n=1 Tax=Trypanosoma grayi TaxID=71804 RepID=UPI0004F4181E|nr:SCY1 family protein kinase [Trypanosoma grayi]KEG08533.1 SCY1 family protein kinase [Trypanosoma grayi]
MAFLWKAMGLSESVPGFPYTPSSGSSSSSTAASPTITWTMRPGVCDEDGRPVTIFSVNLAKADAGMKDLARHAMKRAKSLLLPGLLRCYGATEHQDTVYIATEPCEQLSSALQKQASGTHDEEEGDEEDAFLESVALGLKSVGTALAALHRHNLVHGNVSCCTVYVLPGGEWRLFGLELVSTFNERHGVYQQFASLLPEYRRPPETLQANYEQSLHVSSTDSWGMACLIYEVLGVAKGQSVAACKGSELRNCRSLPRTLQSGFIGLCAANPKMRHDVERFLGNSEFIVGSEFVQCMQVLEELSLKDTVERERFFDHLNDVLDTFPKKACKCLVLPKLHASFQFGVLPGVIDPILKIGAHITSEEEYGTHVAPLILSLFASQDRMVRYRLLQRSSEYAASLPASVVNEKLWPLFSSGFSNTVPSIREYSVRALVPFAKSLSDSILLNEVPKYIAQLQQDMEGAIRTNATIALCLMADMIPADQRSKILVNGFGRMLKDPFVPSRVGALRSLHTTLRHLTPQHIAELMLPGVAPLTVDSVHEVRQVALDAMRGAIERLDAHHAEESAREAKTETAGEGTSGTTGAVPDTNSNKATNSKWGWRWGSSTEDAKAGTVPPPAAETVEAKTYGENGVKGSFGLPPTTAKTTITKTNDPFATSGFDDDCGDDDPWGTDVDVVPVTSSAPRKPSSHRADPGTSTDSATGGRAMKLRKKGLGAARVL